MSAFDTRLPPAVSSRQARFPPYLSAVRIPSRPVLRSYNSPALSRLRKPPWALLDDNLNLPAVIRR
ncbi:hypothetical protein BDW67DRAFT_153789 [Aspergillus spinulosporus]